MAPHNNSFTAVIAPALRGYAKGRPALPRTSLTPPGPAGGMFLFGFLGEASFNETR